MLEFQPLKRSCDISLLLENRWWKIFISSRHTFFGIAAFKKLICSEPFQLETRYWKIFISYQHTLVRISENKRKLLRPSSPWKLVRIHMFEFQPIKRSCTDKGKSEAKREVYFTSQIFLQKAETYWLWRLSFEILDRYNQQQIDPNWLQLSLK